jgi:long-chain acyl-CoA synthetase
MSLYDKIIDKNVEVIDKYAIICDDEKITYRELDNRICELSNLLKTNGITKNSKVALFAEDPLKFSIMLFAINKLNAICIPIYDQTGNDKIVDVINCYDINFIIRNNKKNDIFLYKKIECFEESFYIYNTNRQIDDTLEDIELILFTSGTLSIPKAIMLSERNIISNIESISDYLVPTTNDKILLIKNLSHSSSIIGELFVGLINNSTIVMTRKILTTSTILNVLQNEKISIFFAVPSLLQGIICYNKLNRYDLSNLRIINFYGAKMSKENIESLIDCFPKTNIIYSYGLTEASPRVTYIEKFDLIKKPKSSGKPIKGVNVSIENFNGEKIDGYDVGEIVVTGPNVMKGYYRNQEKTNETIVCGKLYTKDIGYLDEDGFLYVSGRKDNMFINAGKNIYPEEIEGVLLAHKNIKEALVKYEIDNSHDLVIVAYIKIKDGKSIDDTDVFEFCKTKLENYKIPRKIVKVMEIAKTASGKIKRNQSFIVDNMK